MARKRKKKKKAKDEPQYTFYRRARCPACGSLNNRVLSTQGRVQYRRCMERDCEYRWKVLGIKI